MESIITVPNLIFFSQTAHDVFFFILFFVFVLVEPSIITSDFTNGMYLTCFEMLLPMKYVGTIWYR